MTSRCCTIGSIDLMSLSGGGRERPTLKTVLEEYLPRLAGHEAVSLYIALLDNRPFGFAQSYVAMGAGDGWWEDETDPGVRGIDQTIGDPELLGRGLGTKLVCALTALIFEDPTVTKIQVDPAPTNVRAIRCYEKAGFSRTRTIVTPDGPAVYMLKTRRAAERDSP